MTTSMRRGARLRLTGLLSALLLAVMGSAVAAEGFDRELQFRIPSQSLTSALMQFAEQSKIQVLTASNELSGFSSHGVEGRLTPRAALQAILSGTNLSFREVGNGTVTIGPHGAFTPGAEGQAKNNTGNGVIFRQLRLAQADDAQPQGAGAASKRESAEDKNDGNEVVVTGTHVRGIVNRTAPMQTYDRETIAKSGYTTTQDFIRSLPQNFGGGSMGASEDGRMGSGTSRAPNNEGATAMNLRGLGEKSTLVLLNGHRMAPSAFGGVVDVSAIPIGAIERIDVLTDGASAVYGADGVAGVVNFILRKDYEGAESTLRYTDTTHGDMGQITASQSMGFGWNGGNLLSSFTYDDRDSLKSSQRRWTAEAFQPSEIFSENTRYTGLLRATQSVTPDLEIFGDVLTARSDLDRQSATSATSSNRQLVDNVSYNFSAGLTYQTFGDWQVEVGAVHSRQQLTFKYLDYRPNPAALGGYVLGGTALNNHSQVSSGDLKLDGTLFSLGGAKVKAAVGGAYRDEDFTSLIPYSSTNTRFRSFQRNVRSAFAEVYVPLLDERLQLSAAVRRDDYSDFGATTNPKYGVSWSPLESLNLRATWGTSFRAPTADELINQYLGVNVFLYRLTAPSGVGQVPVILLSGTNPIITPEESENWTVGFDYAPSFVEGLKFTFNYYDVNFTNRIIRPSVDLGALQRTAIYGTLLTPLADDAAAAAYLAARVAEGYLYSDPFAIGTTAGMRWAYDLRLTNASYVKQSGFDVMADYTFEAGANAFNARVNVAYIKEILTAFSAGATPTDLVDTFSNPLKLRGRADFSWSRGNWLVNTALNHTGGYIDTTSATRAPVDAWNTLDMSVRYTPSVSSGWLRGASFGLNLINFTDEDPPYVTGGVGTLGVHYDVGAADGRGRYGSIEVRKRW